MERGEGGGFTWGEVEGWGEKAYNCNCITIKIKKIKKKRRVKPFKFFYPFELNTIIKNILY